MKRLSMILIVFFSIEIILTMIGVLYLKFFQHSTSIHAPLFESLFAFLFAPLTVIAAFTSPIGLIAGISFLTLYIYWRRQKQIEIHSSTKMITLCSVEIIAILYFWIFWFATLSRN